MKRVLFIFSLLIFSHASFAQQWLWGRQGTTGKVASGASSVATNDLGNVYLSSRIVDSISFGSYHFKSPNNDFYIIKYDSSGNLLWAKQSKSPSSACSSWQSGLVTDALDNSYVLGYFDDTISIGSWNIYRKRPYNSYLVKFDPNGNVIWARASNNKSGYSEVIALGMNIDKHCNVYITGYMQDTVSFGADTLKCHSMLHDTFFLVKYDSAGNMLWAKQSVAPGITTTRGYSVSADSLGNVFVSGIFEDSIILGSITLRNPKYPYMPIFFVAKYDSSGNILWADKATACGMTNLNYSTTDGFGNAYFTGSFDDSIQFGSFLLKSKPSTVRGDIFLVKYSAKGDLLWAKQSHSSGADNWGGYSLCADKYNHIYFSGGEYVYLGPTGDTVIFLGDTLRSPTGKGPAIVMEFDTGANIICSTIVRVGGNAANGFTCSPSGKYAYLGGDIMDSVTFNKDHLTVGTAVVPPFVARFQPCSGSPIITQTPYAPINSKGIEVYPNPSNGKFTFQSSVNSGQLSVEIYNTLGQKVYDAMLKQVQHDEVIDLSASPSGVYLYRVLDEKGNLIKADKLIISK